MRYARGQRQGSGAGSRTISPVDVTFTSDSWRAFQNRVRNLQRAQEVASGDAAIDVIETEVDAMPGAVLRDDESHRWCRRGQ